MTVLPSVAARPRVAFIDGARALAMWLMVQGHVTDHLLSAEAKATAFYNHYWAVRGVTAPLFLFVSGFAFVLASDAHWGDYLRLGPRTWARLRRVGLLLLLGTLIQMPRWKGALFFDFTEEEWKYVLRWGVLHCVGTSLAVAHLLLAATRTRKLFTVAALALALAAFLTARAVTAFPGQLPLLLRMLSRTNDGSPFPLLPWVGHFLVGAASGRLFLDLPALRRSPYRLAVALAIGGGTLLAISVGMRAFDPTRIAAPDYWVADPTLAMTRAGSAWCLVALCALALGGLARSPRWLAMVGARALSVYVLHLVVLYGVPQLPGLSERIGGTLPLWAGFGLGPVIMLGAVLAVQGYDWVVAAVRARLGEAFPDPRAT
jgi:uncharacterized membrane protein